MMDLVSSTDRLIHPAFFYVKNINLHLQFSEGIPMFTNYFVWISLPRYALQDMDKFSLKDSGRGDSEAGDSDCEMGRESPVDRLLLGEGFSDLMHLEMHHRLHPGEIYLIYLLLLFFSDSLPQSWQHSATTLFFFFFFSFILHFS